MLAPGTRSGLRGLAERSLEALGAPRTDRFVHDEMLRQFAALSSAIAVDEKDRERSLNVLIAAALDEFDSVK